MVCLFSWTGSLLALAPGAAAPPAEQPGETQFPIGGVQGDFLTQAYQETDGVGNMEDNL